MKWLNYFIIIYYTGHHLICITVLFQETNGVIILIITRHRNHDIASKEINCHEDISLHYNSFNLNLQF